MARIDENLHVSKTLSCTNFAPPAACIDDDAIAPGISASKLDANRSINAELAEAATAVAAVTRLLYTARAPATVRGFSGTIVVQATGADRTVSVELKKSTGGGAFATILSTPVQITNVTGILAPVAAVINPALDDLIAGDILEAVVTVAGAAGNQAKGLLVNLSIDEEYA